jgi:hypothetical protein
MRKTPTTLKKAGSAEQPGKGTEKAVKPTGNYSGLSAYVTRRMAWFRN